MLFVDILTKTETRKYLFEVESLSRLALNNRYKLLRYCDLFKQKNNEKY